MNSQSSSKSLARSAIERRLAPLRKADSLMRPPRGWIKALREAVGMTTGQLARRAGVSQPRITAIEKAEVNDTVTLRTLRQVAEGLGCTVVYALVPVRPLDEMVTGRAREVAEQHLARTHHTMALENQPLAARELQAERERLVDELIRGDPRRLWDAP